MANLREGNWTGVIQALADEVVRWQDRPRPAFGARAVDVEDNDAALHALLTDFGGRVLAAAATGGAVVCDDGDTQVPCNFVLRPGMPPYYRCIGHPLAHCYTADFTDLSPCP